MTKTLGSDLASASTTLLTKTRGIPLKLLRGDRARRGFEFLQNHALGEQFREHNRLSRFSRIEHVERHAWTAELSQQFCDHRIAIGPIRFQFPDGMTLKRFSHGGALEHIGLVEFASETPCRREIDKDRVTLPQFSLQPLGCECLPVTVEL